MLDASVGFKWCLPAATEPLGPEAVELLNAFLRSEVEFWVPDLFWIEIGNALWKLFRKGRIALSSAEAEFSKLRDLEIQTRASLGLMPEALQIAGLHDRSVYDSVYVAMARELGVDLVTADEKLANATAAYLPVKWLGAIII